MEERDRRILAAFEKTKVVRPPRQHLATFGATTLTYFIVTKPAYEELVPKDTESVVREGTVFAQRPEVVTPSYVLRLEGFGDEARRMLEMFASQYGPNAPGLFYAYRNEAKNPDIVTGEPEAVADRITSELNGKGSDLAVVITGPDELWDVCLLKFIYEFTAASVAGNVGDLMGQRLLDPDPAAGIPRAAVRRIEELFAEVESGNMDPAALKQELDRWDLFHRYEDRFLGLFRRGLR
jgi:hypothetical protein